MHTNMITLHSESGCFLAWKKSPQPLVIFNSSLMYVAAVFPSHAMKPIYIERSSTPFPFPRVVHRGHSWNRSSGGSVRNLWWSSPTQRLGPGAQGHGVVRSRPPWSSLSSISPMTSSWMVREKNYLLFICYMARKNHTDIFTHAYLCIKSKHWCACFVCIRRSTIVCLKAPN